MSVRQLLITDTESSDYGKISPNYIPGTHPPFSKSIQTYTYTNSTVLASNIQSASDAKNPLTIWANLNGITNDLPASGYNKVLINAYVVATGVVLHIPTEDPPPEKIEVYVSLEFRDGSGTPLQTAIPTTVPTPPGSYRIAEVGAIMSLTRDANTAVATPDSTKYYRFSGSGTITDVRNSSNFNYASVNLLGLIIPKLGVQDIATVFNPGAGVSPGAIGYVLGLTLSN